MMKLPNDAYQLWKENYVTIELLKHIEEEIEMLKNQSRSGTSIERIAIDAIEVQARIDCLRSIQNWRLGNE